MPPSIKYTNHVICDLRMSLNQCFLKNMPINPIIFSYFEISFFQTTSMQMEVMYQHLVPRDWYQMRVLAFSLNGTNGFSKPSRSVRLNIPIRRPHPPRNFTATGAWFQNGKIFVKISWSPPRFLSMYLWKFIALPEKYLILRLEIESIITEKQ